MNTITTEAVVNSDHRLNLNLELPPGSPTGKVTVTLTVEPQVGVNRMAEIRGKYEGQIRIAEDFDAPLEDFTEYM
jgi:hypothetical protein